MTLESSQNPIQKNGGIGGPKARNSGEANAPQITTRKVSIL